MNNTSSNPSIYFYRNYEGSILRTRESLFAELDGISSDFGNEARKILKDKLLSNNNNPLMGELFPWIIKDLINADNETTHKISVGWLAIYLYTIFLDEYVDNPKPIETTKFIAGSILAKTGLLKISHLTNNTPYDSFIDKAFSFSAKNQQLDSKFQNKITDIDFKEKYSEGKNHIVLVCAGALASQNSQHAEFITEFSKHLLLTLQYLDDIADYKEDFEAKNYTVLLNEAFKSHPYFLNSQKTITSRELLSELIITGALQRVIQKVITLLDQSILLLSQNNLTITKSAAEFFYSLQAQCQAINIHLKKYQSKFKNLSLEKRDFILDNIEERIAIIAQSS